ncbi:MAG: ImuA family protein [Planctomycetaceae bacterium]
MVTFGVGIPGPVEPVRAGVALGGRGGDREAVSSGWPVLDGLFAGGGVRRGGLIEWLAGEKPVAAAGCGSGAATLACAVACRLAASRRPGPSGAGGLIVVVDRAGWFHPPAVLPWLGTGPAASRLVVARPSRDDDEIWAVEQALRCAGVAAVVAWPRLAAAWTIERGVAAERELVGRGGFQRWTTAMRRWQLAARSGGAAGLLVRPPAALGEPSWAESRLAVSALPGGSLLERRLRVARVGGAWRGVGSGAVRPVEIGLDLARGLPVEIHPPVAVAEGGAPCLAS